MDGKSEPVASSGKRILLVDDDAVIRLLTAEILDDIGYAVSVAANAAEARKLFTEYGGAFDLLFSDVVLTDGNGLDLADALLDQSAGLPVLLFSGHSDERVRLELIHERGFNYMRKPFNLKKLIDMVETTIDGTYRACSR